MNIDQPSTSKLYLFQLARVTVPVPPDRSFELVLASYLIETSDGRRILIDTGIDPATRRPGSPPAREECNVLEQLARLGLSPKDIDTVTCTHFDVDHAGFHDAFPNAEFVVQRSHYELARAGHPRYAAARPHWDHPSLHYRFVDGDTDLAAGVRLIETGGHVPGHQSVLVRLPKTGNVLLAIDAVAMQRLFTVERTATAIDDNEDQLRASTQKLLDLVACEDVKLVVFGHDGSQWDALRRSPEFYD